MRDTRRIERIARSPGGTTKTDLERALRAAGWWLQRQGSKHEIWTNGSETVPVPRTPKGTWTIKKVAQSVLTAEEANGGE
jgi:hypothetical protein